MKSTPLNHPQFHILCLLHEKLQQDHCAVAFAVAESDQAGEKNAVSATAKLGQDAA